MGLGICRQVFIATKLMGDPIGTMAPPPNMGPQLYGAESFEHSLRVLQTDHVDLMYSPTA